MDSFHLEPQQIKRSWVILKPKKKLENSVNHTKSHDNILTELLRGPGGTPLVGLEGVFLDRTCKRMWRLRMRGIHLWR